MAIFESLELNYPTKPKKELYAALGGEWPSLVDDPNYQNTCAIRMSVAFHAAGYKIPGKFKEAVAGDGRTIIVKVKTMWDYVTESFGAFTWGMSKNPGTVVKIPVKEGIIVYHKAFSDATGHFDLWKSTTFVGAGKLSDVTDGFDIALWYWD
jgi:hypothetical protein